MSAAGSPSPAGGGNIFGSSGIGGFGYGVGASVGVLLIVSTVALAIYFCSRTSMPVAAAASPPRSPRPRRDDDVIDVEAGGGIDEATLEAFPAVAWKKDGGGEACCPVCLENYGDGEVVRTLPDCGHVFHRECVDPWLRQRPTCPVCRTSPLPSPMPTPLAEVTPLALVRPSS
uniref:RING-type domain-containing protein n=1 Tax=Leersia perrieri TaxID=77586 RepID=A0A0D9WVP1_9ORYZ